MTVNELHNIQSDFIYFIGPWIVIFIGAAVAAAVCWALLGLLWKTTRRVKIVYDE